MKEHLDQCVHTVRTVRSAPSKRMFRSPPPHILCLVSARYVVELRWGSGTTSIRRADEGDDMSVESTVVSRAGSDAGSTDDLMALDSAVLTQQLASAKASLDRGFEPSFTTTSPSRVAGGGSGDGEGGAEGGGKKRGGLTREDIIRHGQLQNIYEGRPSASDVKRTSRSRSSSFASKSDTRSRGGSKVDGASSLLSGGGGGGGGAAVSFCTAFAALPQKLLELVDAPVEPVSVVQPALTPYTNSITGIGLRHRFRRSVVTPIAALITGAISPSASPVNSPQRTSKKDKERDRDRDRDGGSGTSQPSSPTSSMASSQRRDTRAIPPTR